MHINHTKLKLLMGKPLVAIAYEVIQQKLLRMLTSHHTFEKDAEIKIHLNFDVSGIEDNIRRFLVEDGFHNIRFESELTSSCGVCTVVVIGI